MQKLDYLEIHIDMLSVAFSYAIKVGVSVNFKFCKLQNHSSYFQILNLFSSVCINFDKE